MEQEITENFFSNIMTIPRYLGNAYANSLNNYQENNTKNSMADAMNFFINLKNYISDPLAIFFMCVGFFISYIYFAGEILCQFIGLFYPCYYIYTLMHNKIPDKTVKIRSIMKYFIIYAHTEFISTFFKIIGLPMFYHIKILVLIAFIYSAQYRNEWINNIYDKTIIYDRIVLSLCYSSYQKLVDEYYKADNTIKKNNNN